MELIKIMQSDVIVIGGGLSGMIAAARCIDKGKSVTLLTLGAGTLTIGGGIIDVLGYSPDGKAVDSPKIGLEKINENHPYSKIGVANIIKSIDYFKKLCADGGYEYLGNINELRWLPTSAGTMKPSCLIPKTMDSDFIFNNDTILVLGFRQLKDFYPKLLVSNLENLPDLSEKKFITHNIDPDIADERDVINLDIARWLDTEKGIISFINQLKNIVKPGFTVLLPPILGTNPNYRVLERLKSDLQCNFVEVASLPPCITGFRLHTLLIKYLKDKGVRILEQSYVTKSVIKGNKCKSVIVGGFGREKEFSADSFILANGGLYGGGLYAEPGKVIEPIFNLPVNAPSDHELWTNNLLFSNEAQPFAKLGLDVNSQLKPIDVKGDVILDNIYIVGRNLSGSDFSFEKSGNGVAIASGFTAAEMACGGADEKAF